MLGLNYIDLLIILSLIIGIVVGFKRGFIKSFFELALLLCSVIIALHLKNPISIFLYKHFPIISFSKIIILNILIYEVIAFILCMSLLMIVVRVILRLSGILDKILKATIILNIPSRILGAICGLIQNFVIVFITLLILSHFKTVAPFIKDSKYSNDILNKTPILNKYSKNTNSKYVVLFSIIDKYKNNDTNKANIESLKFMIDNKLIDKDNVKYLIDNKKIIIDDNENILK